MRSRARALVAFRSRDFRLVWAGQTVSMIGDAAFVVALGWRAFTLSGSGALAVVLTLQALGMLVTLLVGGALADRYSRRTLMIASDVARFIIVGALVAFEAAGSSSIETLGGVALLTGLASGFFMPVGLVAAGALAELASPQLVMATGAAISVAMFAAALPTPWLRTVD